jgi:putative endonuclease
VSGFWKLKKLLIFAREFAGVAQLVEHDLAKVGVASSSLVSRSNKKAASAVFFVMCCFVYILHSKSLDLFYKGQSIDLSDRLRRHNLKQEKSTKKGAPWTLIWFRKLSSRSEAMILEKKLKNLSQKRLLEFMQKNPSDVASPDIPLERKSGC